ncbi:methylated-DNA--[protein]-cysteine S-methyltransferase [Acidiphilium sp. AL]|uniref:Methylated-DNA--[protein]-cysteine S-methyltransferase n=1 Tax=Acidiphilium iwatense TaxID=768198 RepID=A0ABS9DX89_9PROT|nr:MULTISPECIES: methylated-DNA--[protein]-cysteine S-methyltransferase [Acidiphilium]MCF3946316.1 methylated-DNA--[protein]-cysteine S-methyltransferase [Acidiphilium iwatense]MCU4159900.1 methylated-DNA--[protein]-cysteine S-methyltransferase [Acidiphilium sp. AL]
MPHISIHHPAFGDILLREAGGAIVSLDWESGADDAPTPLLRRAAEALQAYFRSGVLPADLPLAPAGTAYQRRVWACLRRIPRGEIRTYGAVASEAGGSARAVGGANRANPIPILIPCHRVCAANGLGGYAGSDRDGWGLDMKRRLLELEGAV